MILKPTPEMPEQVAWNANAKPGKAVRFSIRRLKQFSIRRGLENDLRTLSRNCV